MTIPDSITNAAILGASGTIGSCIGGLLAEQGIRVYFLSRTWQGATRGLEKAIAQARSEVISRNIVCGDYEHSLGNALELADLIIESVTENLPIKQEIHEKIERYMRPDAIIGTTTSSLPLTLLAQGRSKDFRRNFLATHFYNPPRHMIACEVTGTDDTDIKVCDFVAEFLEKDLRRVVIRVKNVPGFAGNRIAFLLFSRITALAEEYGVELMDYLIGPYTGRVMPPLATLDLVGLDIYRAIIESLSQNTHDEMHECFVFPEYINKMINIGILGNKTKQGFYRKLESGKYAFWEPSTATYTAAIEPHIAFVEQAKRLTRMGMYRQAFDAIKHARNKEARLIIDILCTYVDYAYHRVGEVAALDLGISPIDRVMIYGFHWAPPSVILNMLGRDFVVERLEQMGMSVPEVLKNHSAFDETFVGVGKYFVAA